MTLISGQRSSGSPGASGYKCVCVPVGVFSTLCCALFLESIFPSAHPNSLPECPSTASVNLKQRQILLDEREGGREGEEGERNREEKRRGETTGEERAWREDRERRQNGVKARRKSMGDREPLSLF